MRRPSATVDLNHAELIVIAGANATWDIRFCIRRLRTSRRRTRTRPTFRIDPRRTETARAADPHLANLPGTDVALFNAVPALELSWEDAIDAVHQRPHQLGSGELRH